MPVGSGGRAELAKQQGRSREAASPERTVVWAEPRSIRSSPRKVPVVYYLCRNGQLEHPHFTEISLPPSSDGLYLRDVINRLDSLRGKGMASLYSWSSKRIYKNGYVWHDLIEDDFIYPAHGNEYVLKGSELLHPLPPGSGPRDASASSSSSSEKPLVETPRPPPQDDSHLGRGRKKATPWGSFDLGEYRVFKAEATAEGGARAADAATQTDDRAGRPPRRQALAHCDEERAAVPALEGGGSPTTELGSDEISPPPSSSSPETLATLVNADLRAAAAAAAAAAAQLEDGCRNAGMLAGGRMRASAVLMHLISCGSISVKDHSFSAAAQHRERLPRGQSDLGRREMDGLGEAPGFAAMDREYFSGSLVETKMTGGDGGAAEFPGLKRSSSYNADRSSKMMEIGEKGRTDDESVRGKCIPRKPKSAVRKSEASGLVTRSNLGSKRFAREDASCQPS